MLFESKTARDDKKKRFAIVWVWVIDGALSCSAFVVAESGIELLADFYIAYR